MITERSLISPPVTRVAVVGHVEWVEFVPVPRFPARGKITSGSGAFVHAGGGAVVAAAVMAALGAEVDLFCALGRDDTGDAAAAELTARGITVHAAWRDVPTRRVITLLEPAGERTIITLGERLEPTGSDPLPWSRLEDAEALYLTAGDAGAAREARRSPILVATPRARGGLGQSGVAIDALVYSAGDADERHWAAALAERSAVTVETEGAHGGHWSGRSCGRWPAATVPGEPRDSYGCGDAFAAGLTVGLSRGLSMSDAVQIGAEQGAAMLTRAGAP